MLSKFSVKRPYTVLVGVLLILILGLRVDHEDDDGSASEYESSLCGCLYHLYRGQPGRGGDNGYKAGREFDGYH